MNDEETFDPLPTLPIVVLGASYAGITAVHNIISHVLPEVSTDKFSYRIVVVSPSTHLYWNISGPRALVSDALIPHSDSFQPVSKGLDQYPAGLVEFIQAGVTSIDTRSRTITVARVESDDLHEACAGHDQSLKSKTGTLLSKAKNRAADAMVNMSGVSSPTDTSRNFANEPGFDASDDIFEMSYHALIIATGSTAHSPLLSLRGPHTNTRAALDSFHARLPTADTVVIAGGGPSGVETAGQISYWYNLPEGPLTLKNRSMLSRLAHMGERPGPHAKKVILLSSSARVLPYLDEATSRKALKQLTSLGVRVVCGIRAEGASVHGATGRTTLRLSNGTTMQCDLFVPCTGVNPNTQFIPPDSPLLDAEGYIATTPEPSTLRVDVPAGLMPLAGRGEGRSPTAAAAADTPDAFGGNVAAAARVYALGDCAAYSKNCILDVYIAIPVLVQNVTNDLKAHQQAFMNPYGGNAGEIQELQRQDAVYAPDPRDSQLCPIGYARPGGVGVVFGHKLPSLAVFVGKGWRYKLDTAPKAIMEGLSPYKTKPPLED